MRKNEADSIFYLIFILNTSSIRIDMLYIHHRGCVVSVSNSHHDDGVSNAGLGMDVFMMSSY